MTNYIVIYKKRGVKRHARFSLYKKKYDTVGMDHTGVGSPLIGVGILITANEAIRDSELSE